MKVNGLKENGQIEDKKKRQSGALKIRSRLA